MPRLPSSAVHTAPQGPKPATTTSNSESMPLLRHYADVPGKLRPAPMLGAQELRQLLGRAGAFGDDAELDQALRHVGLLDCRVEVAVEAPDRFVRRAGRHDHGVPADVLEAGPGFSQRRHLVQAG